MTTSGGNGESGVDDDKKVRMFSDEIRYVKKDNYFWNMLRRSKEVEVEEEEIATVVDDGEVVWEQRLKDVEAERGRKKVTSPGFSFLAAGLLFPYNLGVAKFLIEKDLLRKQRPWRVHQLTLLYVQWSHQEQVWRRPYKLQRFWLKIVEVEGLHFILGLFLEKLLNNFFLRMLI